MRPSDIVAANPDADIMSLKDLKSFVVAKGLALVFSAEDAFDCWDTTIVSRNKTIAVKTMEYPAGILENEDLIKVLGNRFHPP